MKKPYLNTIPCRLLFVVFCLCFHFIAHGQGLECAGPAEPAITDCDCCPGLVAVPSQGGTGPIICMGTGDAGLDRAFFMGGDTSHCGPLTFNLFSLLELHSFMGGNAVYGSLRYGSSFNNYTDTITTDVIVNTDTVFYLENIAPGGCTDTAMVTITIETPPDAGMDNDTMLCEGESVDLDLLTSQAGGTYSESIVSGGLLGNTFNTTGLAPGIFPINYVVTGGSICENDTAVITIFANSPVTAGMDRDTTVCDGEIVDLTSLVSIFGGTFSEPVPSGGLNGTEFNSMNLSPGSYDIDYAVLGSGACANDTAVITVHVINDMTCLMDYTTSNTLSFSDPCRCDNPLNSSLGALVLLEDTLVVMGPPGQGVVFEAINSSGFLDINGDPIPDQTSFTEGPDGIYKLQFYQLSGQQPIVYISLNQGPAIQVDNDTFGMCICQLIPTLGQWGIVILGLLFGISGITMFRKFQSNRTLC